MIDYSLLVISSDVFRTYCDVFWTSDESDVDCPLPFRCHNGVNFEGSKSGSASAPKQEHFAEVLANAWRHLNDFKRFVHSHRVIDVNSSFLNCQATEIVIAYKYDDYDGLIDSKRV